MWSIERRRKQVPQLATRIGEVTAGHQHRDPGGFGDPVVGPVFDVGEQNDLALDGCEPSQRGEEAQAQVGSLELSDGRVAPGGGDGLVEWNESPATDGASAVQRAPVGDREEPGRKARGLAAGGELFEGVHEGLLGNVIRLGWIAQDGERPGESGAAIPADQHRERVLFSRQCPVNQLFVRRFGRHVETETPESRKRESRYAAG